MENVNLLNINPNEWTLVGFRSYKSGVLEWDVHREFAERMFGKRRLDYMEKKDLFHQYVKLAERDAIWLFHRRVPGTRLRELDTEVVREGVASVQRLGQTVRLRHR